MLRTCITALVTLLTVSCQTPRKLDSKLIPITLRPQFSLCYPLDGLLAAKISEDQSLVGSGELVWSQNLRREFNAQWMTTFGNSLASVKVKGNDIQITNQILKEIPTVEFEDEKIMIDGYFSGLLISEIGCFLAGKLPFEWQEEMIHFQQKGKDAEIEFTSHDRTIHTQMNGHTSFCTKILTSYYLGLKKNEITICTDRTNLLKIVFRSSKFELNLEEVEDGT